MTVLPDLGYDARIYRRKDTLRSVKIKRLEISGFKSFEEKATFDFPPGVTAVVGPNGCGKSNVVDAIRWVMGEQSAKNLRGRQMEDVIFGGSESRKPLGMAEVSLIFSTSDGRIPAKYLNFSEIQVTRRLYRDGESEYLLNRTPCRLMDITELFMDTGIGTRAYSIIEQGRIGMILMAKPEERRFLIEEAAGVTKYKSRKQVALKKIDATRQNLLRIGDVVGEVKRQLNSLHRQAKKAERFRAVREELRGIELFFASRRHGELSGQRELLATEVATLEHKNAALAAVLELKESLLDRLRLELLEEEQRLTVVQEDIFRGRAELQGAENLLEFQRREIASLEAQSGRLSEEIVLLQRQIADAEAEKGLLELRRSEFSSSSLGEEEALAQQERQLEELAAAEKVASLTLDDSRKRLFGLIGEISQAGNQQAAAAKSLDQLAERVQRSTNEEQSLQGLLVQAEEHVVVLQAKLLAEQSRLATLAESIRTLSAGEEAAKSSLAGIEQELQQGREEHSAVASRLHSLQDLEAQFAGYGQGVRTLMLADSFKGRFAGLLADVVEVEEEYESALEAVLGGRLQSLLAGSEADVHDAVQHLKNCGGGRCGFLLPVSGSWRADSLPEGAKPLLSLVTLPEAGRPVMESLLHRVMLVPDLETAVRLAKAHHDFRFVTLQGDLAYGGIVVGGSREPVQQGLIHKKREIRALAARKISCGEKVATLSAARHEHLLQISAAGKELQTLQQAQRNSEISLLTAEKDLQRALEEVQRFHDRIQLKSHEDEQLNEERELLQREMIAAGIRKESAETLKSVLEQEIALIQDDLAAKRNSIDGARSEVTAMKVRAASLKEKQESALAAIQRVVHLHDSLRERLARQTDALQQGEAALERIRSESAAAGEQLRLQQKEHVAREERLVVVKAAYDAALLALKEEEHQLKEIKGEEEALRRLTAETGYKQSAALLELNNLEAQLRERFRMEISDVAAHSLDVAGDETEMALRQLELQNQVDEFGEVNLTAIEEYQELEERHTFLVGQKADLEESLNSLQQVIQRINRTTRKRFAETFELVNEKFKEVFPRLFCGGRAELKLTNEDDLLETGLDIIVQPPGKKLQNVSLLSGGEKALTAVALIFSIFLIKPSPFCLLDEVDAPLDDANIGRFNELVREMSLFSQFILITHSKTTMAVADTLYGITMEEPGVSKLVSVKLN
ncbi:MAG: chromosome segregation ATPase [Deltaproteobacteria bacterium]|nr:chromosome segregation ATPase [Deltaproteobacteria bacterium]